LEFIDRPLGFYVLSLLIVESFIGLVATLGLDSGDDLRMGLYLGVGMFVYITLTVTLIVWKKAHVLTFDRDAHLSERQTSTPPRLSRAPSNGARVEAPHEAGERKKPDGDPQARESFAK
jgi:hypothetical protein